MHSSDGHIAFNSLDSYNEPSISSVDTHNRSA
jgi:hypothetical protein